MGIILDDPVTSFGDRWKETLAQLLAEQAQSRQVVVFTHDLSFLYHIRSRADELGVSVASHWVKDHDGRPGFVFADNGPVCEKDYKSAKIAREYYEQAKKSPPSEQQAKLQQGFGALRTSYEALVMFEMFNGVVARFEERVSFERLKDVRIDQPLVNETIAHMATLSRYIDAHSHSDAFVATKPTPAHLLAEIEAFENIRERQRQLKKLSANLKP